MCTARGLVPLALIVIASCAGARSVPAAWLANGNPVCTAPGAQLAPAAIPDGSSGMFVSWLDQRPGSPGVYTQRLLADGSLAPGWPVNGVLCSGASPAGAPITLTDGSGGALIVWLGDAIYAQRIDANGTLHAGWPAAGRLITSDVFAYGNPQYVAAAPDGAGGAYVTRVVFNPQIWWNTLLLTRIDSDGNFAPGWTEAGVGLGGSENVTLFGIRPDPTGGVVVAMGYYINQQVDSRHGVIKHIRPDGTAAYIAAATAYYSGNTAPYGIFHVAAASDSAGGAYATWFDQSSSGPGYFGQHLGPAGAATWTAPYLAPFSEQVIRDGVAGVWYVGRPGGALEVHRRLADGALPAGWMSAGVTISQPLALGSVAAATFPTVVVLCWSENTTGAGHDIRALSVRQDGLIPPGWDPGGTVFCGAEGDQTAPVLVLEGTGALACWQDGRPGSSSPDIYATRIQPAPTVGVGPDGRPSFALLDVRPNPARDGLDVDLALAGAGPATLEVLDLGGRRVQRIEVGGPGRRVVPLALGRLEPGVYWLRVLEGAQSAVRRVAVVR